MDTRNKIVSPEQATALLTEGHWLAVVGYFDPMTAFEAERLSTVARLGKVLGIVLEDIGTLLSADSRAILVASLRDVTAVVIAKPETWRSYIPHQATVSIVADIDDEQTRRGEFRELVLNRLGRK